MIDIVVDLAHTIKTYSQFNDDHTKELIDTLAEAQRTIIGLRRAVEDLQSDNF